MKVTTHNVFEPWPLEDKSIQAIITSPPYWSLRKYDIPDIQIGDWLGQYGLESTYQAYIEHTRLWAKEARRVLKDDGVFFLNLGDSYNGNKTGHTDNKNKKANSNVGSKISQNTIQDKCKILIPHRVAIALIDDDWILRNDLVWFKPNSMPESVTDRFSKKFEYIFMFSKSQKYYFDLDSVREDFGKWAETDPRIFQGRKTYNGKMSESVHSRSKGATFSDPRPEGKNPGDLWRINTQPSSFKHYSMWPEKLVERMILCSTKKGGTVLDPFMGSGTTLYVADQLNRIGKGFDLGYHDIQKKRLSGIQKQLI